MLHNTDTFTLLPTFGDKSVDLIVTDVPYDFNEDQKKFLHSQFLRIAKRCVIVFSPPENQWVSPVDQFLFWVKPISTKNTSKSYSRFVEMIFLYELDDYIWNSHRHWSQYTNVFNDLVDLDEEMKHPYRKPISLLLRLLRNHAKKGDVVFDPFMGSGSVLEAAKMCGLQIIGNELNAEWYNLAKGRLNVNA